MQVASICLFKTILLYVAYCIFEFSHHLGIEWSKHKFFPTFSRARELPIAAIKGEESHLWSIKLQVCDSVSQSSGIRITQRSVRLLHFLSLMFSEHFSHSTRRLFCNFVTRRATSASKYPFSRGGERLLPNNEVSFPMRRQNSGKNVFSLLSPEEIV